MVFSCGPAVFLDSGERDEAPVGAETAMTLRYPVRRFALLLYALAIMRCRTDQERTYAHPTNR